MTPDSLSPLAPLLSYPRKRVSSKHRRRRENRERAGYWIVRSSRTMTVEFAARGRRSSLSCSHQCLAAGEGGRGRLVGGLLRQQHFVVRLAGRDHRETILQRRHPAVEQHRALDRDHLLDRAVEIAGLDRLQADAAIGVRELDEIRQ